MDVDGSTQLNNGDEIDLFELIENLWNQKLLIALFSIFFVLLGYGYTLVAPEKWTAEVYISDPSLNQINALNPPELAAFRLLGLLDGRLEDGSRFESRMLSAKVLNEVAPEIGPVDLMKSITSEIRSVQTLLQFDAQRSESIFENSAHLIEGERIEAAKVFLENRLKITQPSKTTSYIVISLTLDSPTRASSVLRDYLQFVGEKIVKKRGENLKLGITRAIQVNEFEIERAMRSHVRRLEEEFALLEEALQIAQSAGIKDNQAGLFVDRNDNRLTETSGLYARGERLLKAEMQALKARISSLALIPEVRSLQLENKQLKDIVIDTERASSFFLEKPATEPTGRDSPKTKLILALALVLGGMVGVLVALIRSARRDRKSKALA